MISIMELMEKKTPLIKKNKRKKGMTLVEVMVAMAILSILFVGISGFIMGIVKNEAKSNRKLESDGYLKSALLMFESGVVSIDENLELPLEFEVSFDNITEMQEGIINLKDTEEGNGTYKMVIEITYENENSNLYRVDATFINSNAEKYSKHIYVSKRD